MDKSQLFQFISEQKTAFLASVNEQGYPVIRAMLAPRKIDGNENLLHHKHLVQQDQAVFGK